MERGWGWGTYLSFLCCELRETSHAFSPAFLIFYRRGT